MGKIIFQVSQKLHNLLKHCAAAAAPASAVLWPRTWKREKKDGWCQSLLQFSLSRILYPGLLKIVEAPHSAGILISRLKIV